MRRMLQRKGDLFVGDLVVIHIHIDLILTRRYARPGLIHAEVGFPLSGGVDVQQRRIEIIIGQHLLYAKA
ncbi:hypothetical protein D3C81_2286230 [compost metagenome]